MSSREGCKTHPERIVGRFELQGSTATEGISTEILFSSENSHLSKSKLSWGARGREEGKFSLEVFTFPQKTVKFEMFQVDIFASRNSCYSGMCVSSVKLYTVKKRHKNVR